MSWCDQEIDVLSRTSRVLHVGTLNPVKIRESRCQLFPNEIVRATFGRGGDYDPRDRSREVPTKEKKRTDSDPERQDHQPEDQWASP